MKQEVTSSLRCLTERPLDLRSSMVKAMQDHRTPPSAASCFFASFFFALALALDFSCFRTLSEIRLRLRLGLAVLDVAGVAASNSGAVANDAISVSVGEDVVAAGAGVGAVRAVAGVVIGVVVMLVLLLLL